MKPVTLSKTLVITTVFLFSVLTCMGQNDPVEQVVGKWIKTSDMGSVTFTITADNKYEVAFTGGEEPDVWGTYETEGTQITFTDKGGEYSSGTSGKYEFKVSDTSINFTAIDDPVDGRSMLVEGDWSKADTVE